MREHNKEMPIRRLVRDANEKTSGISLVTLCFDKALKIQLYHPMNIFFHAINQILNKRAKGENNAKAKKICGRYPLI
jgi:hypothetical protein